MLKLLTDTGIISVDLNMKVTASALREAGKPVCLLAPLELENRLDSLQYDKACFYTFLSDSINI